MRQCKCSGRIQHGGRLLQHRRHRGRGVRCGCGRRVCQRHGPDTGRLFVLSSTIDCSRFPCLRLQRQRRGWRLCECEWCFRWPGRFDCERRGDGDRYLQPGDGRVEHGRRISQQRFRPGRVGFWHRCERDRRFFGCPRVGRHGLWQCIDGDRSECARIRQLLHCDRCGRVRHRSGVDGHGLSRDCVRHSQRCHRRRQLRHRLCQPRRGRLQQRLWAILQCNRAGGVRTRRLFHGHRLPQLRSGLREHG